MLDSFLEAIGRVGIFMICARAIVHFRPKEADEKYMKLLVSIMILIQLFLPLGSVFLGGEGGETVAALERFKADLQQSMQEAEINAARADALLEQMTLEEVRKRMEEQAQAQGQARVEEQAGARMQGTVEAHGQESSEAQRQETEEQEKKEIQVEPVDEITVGQ